MYFVFSSSRACMVHLCQVTPQHPATNFHSPNVHVRGPLTQTVIRTLVGYHPKRAPYILMIVFSSVPVRSQCTKQGCHRLRLDPKTAVVEPESGENSTPSLPFLLTSVTEQATDGSYALLQSHRSIKCTLRRLCRIFPPSAPHGSISHGPAWSDSDPYRSGWWWWWWWVDA